MLLEAGQMPSVWIQRISVSFMDTSKDMGEHV